MADLSGPLTSSYPSEDNLTELTVHGVAWSSISSFLVQAVRFVLSVVLARLLSPNDYGLLSMVMVIVGFAALFMDVGFGAALVQAQELNDRHFQSVFWMNLGLGIALAALFYFSAPLLAQFYKNPRLESLTQVLSLSFLISAPAVVPNSILQRSMRFDLLAVAEISAIISSGILAVVMAMAGMGVWSLAGQTLGSHFVVTVIVIYATRWRPHFQFSWSAIRDLLRYSGYLSGFRVIKYWAFSFDSVLIGRFFNSFYLGIYNRAFHVMLLPVSQVMTIIGRVLLPVLSLIQDEPHRVRRAYLRVVGLSALVAFPMVVGMMLTARPFILTLFGPKWTDSSPILQILSIASLALMLGTPTELIYSSQGRTDRQFWWGAIQTLTLFTAIITGVLLGSIREVALCYALAHVLLLYPQITIAGRLIGMRFAHIADELKGIALCTAAMGGILLLAKIFMPADWPPIAQLLSLTGLGAVFYISVIHLFRLHAYLDLRRIARSQWQRAFVKSEEDTPCTQP